MSVRSLFDVPVETLTKPKPKKKDAERGCAFCPMNQVPGIKKIMGRIRGRKIAVFAQSPGPDENDEGRELVGESGQFWWEELSRVGIERKDCDVQNVMRCFPADWKEGRRGEYLQMRNPAVKELNCCSIYTDEAVAQLQANQILVLGVVAAKALLKTRSLPKAKAFWHEALKAKVYLLDHPAFFVRGYGQGPRMDAFRALLDQVAADRKKLNGTNAEEVSDPYWYIKSRDYRPVVTGRQARRAVAEIREIAGTKRVAVDIEDDEGRILCCGVCPKPGLTHVFILDHKDVPDTERAEIRAALTPLLADASVEKALQYGCTDAMKLEAAGMPVQGYTHDTYFSEFLRFSDLKAYGLSEIAQRRFPMFGNYWTVIVDELLAGVEGVPPKVAAGSAVEKYKYVEDKQLFHLSKLSIETLVLYNGADCDLTKRIEIQNKKAIPQALMQLYVDLGFLLYKMEPAGPLFDYEQHEKLDLIYPVKVKQVKAQARAILRAETRWYEKFKKFNPGSPEQVKQALYNKKYGLGLDYPFEGDRKQGKANTRKMTMLTLARKHKFPGVCLEFRSVSKVKSTYLNAYVKCARMNADRLRTKWKGTGARTGRLSSGGEVKKTGKLINLQNIKKDPQMLNMCIADTRWRQVFSKIGALLEKHAPEVLQFWARCDRKQREAVKAGEKWKAPEMAHVVKKKLAVAARLIVEWLQEHIPDFKTFLVADYGQMEIRTGAQMSGDEQLLKDCEEADIHTTVGVAMTGWDAEAIAHDDATRTLTKNVHFGIFFGISKENEFQFVRGMTPPEVRKVILRRLKREQPDMEPEDAWREQVEAAYDRYFERYPGVRRFIDSQREFGREHKYVKTLFGMIQTLNVSDDFQADEVIDPDEMGGRSAYWGNQAINGPVQGTAHQLLICALVNLIRKAKKYAILGIPPMEVHDALYFTVEVLRLQEAVRKTKYLLEKESLKTVAEDFPDIDWKVPIVVETKAGVRLGTKVDVDVETDPGQFLIEWYRVCQKQMKALDKELLACAAGVA